MSTGKAQQWIIVSAVITAGMYFLRRMVEEAGIGTSSKSKVSAILGSGAPAPLGTWLVAYGITYLGLAVIALGAPELAGAFAILIVAVNGINNGITVTSDLGALSNTGGARAPRASSLVIGAAPVTPPQARASNIVAAQVAAHNNQYGTGG